MKKTDKAIAKKKVSAKKTSRVVKPSKSKGKKPASPTKTTAAGTARKSPKKTAAKSAKKTGTSAKPKASPKPPAKSRSKSLAKPKPAVKPKAKPRKKAVLRREDQPGHLDPKYAASLRALGSHATDGDRAFVRGQHSNDDLAEELGEGAVVAMTTGEDSLGDDLQADVEEDAGGPFVTTSGRKEFARGIDESNPLNAKREPFPKT